VSLSQENHLIIVAGPTAVGKTELCLRLAEKFDAEIISADSRQFFKELSIGTAKPTPEELKRVPHHFINSHSIAESYSAGDFERDALALLPSLFEKNNRVIMTGGSGLYIKAVCEGLDDLPHPTGGLREKLTARLQQEGLEVLQQEVSALDPLFSATAEIHNPQRVVRALEVWCTTGKPISSFQKSGTVKRPFNLILIALDRDRQELYQRIEARMDQMLQQGLVDEAKAFADYRRHHALQTVGYKEVYGYLDGLYDESEMVRLLKQNTRRYAKRQLTWFRNQGNFTWFHADDEGGVSSFLESELAHQAG
jgi:tRNA dimethylallyltransferase